MLFVNLKLHSAVTVFTIIINVNFIANIHVHVFTLIKTFENFVCRPRSSSE